jgi:hypothetical protein
MIAWMIATNHCAFGLMNPTRTAAAEHAHCCGRKPAPIHHAPANGIRECCKAIHAIAAAEKLQAKVDTSELQLPPFIRVAVLAPDVHHRLRPCSVFDHGPPRAISFAEAVLQRSLLGHAPPLAV